MKIRKLNESTNDVQFKQKFLHNLEKLLERYKISDATVDIKTNSIHLKDKDGDEDTYHIKSVDVPMYIISSDLKGKVDSFVLDTTCKPKSAIDALSDLFKLIKKEFE